MSQATARSSEASGAFKVAERECATIARREAKNFYWGFLALPRDKRTAIYALYDFARHLGLSDEQAAGGRRSSRESPRPTPAPCRLPAG